VYRCMSRGAYTPLCLGTTPQAVAAAQVLRGEGLGPYPLKQTSRVSDMLPTQGSSWSRGSARVPDPRSCLPPRGVGAECGSAPGIWEPVGPTHTAAHRSRGCCRVWERHRHMGGVAVSWPLGVSPSGLPRPSAHPSTFYNLHPTLYILPCIRILYCISHVHVDILYCISYSICVCTVGPSLRGDTHGG
jgi:hypothetical protein